MKKVIVALGLSLGFLITNPAQALEMVGEVTAVSISDNLIEIDHSPASLTGTMDDIKTYQVPRGTRFIHHDADDRVTNLMGVKPGVYIRFSVDDPKSEQPKIVDNPIIYIYPQE